MLHGIPRWHTHVVLRESITTLRRAFYPFRGSQVVTVTAHLTDTGSTCAICGNSGASSASFDFYSPSGNQAVGAGFGSYNRVSGTAQDGIYQPTLTIPKLSESGNWAIAYVYVYDAAQNRAD